MKTIEISLTDKQYDALNEIIESLKPSNPNTELTPELVLSKLSKDYIGREYGRLMSQE